MLPLDVLTKKIVKDMMNYVPKISFEVNSKNDIGIILDIVRYESFATFHVKTTIPYYYHPLRRVVEIIPEYVYSQSEYHDLINKILIKLRQIKKEIDVLPTELDKEKYIHDYLCKNVFYKENGPDSHCVLGPLFRGEGVCEGIAKTAQALLKIAKLNAHIVCGQATDESGETTGHAWNIVQINGYWHLLDITYDNTISEPDFIRYDYFNLSAKELSVSHKPDSYCREYFNRCTTSNSYFRMNNCEFYNAIDVYDYIKREVRKKSPHLYFKYINSSRRLDIDNLVNYTLELDKVTNVKYTYDEQMGIYHFRVKYGGFFFF